VPWIAGCWEGKGKEKVEDSTLNVHKNNNKFSHQAQYTRSVFLVPPVYYVDYTRLFELRKDIFFLKKKKKFFFAMYSVR
jgi:hypothetical protein